MTEIIKINSYSPEKEILERAGKVIRKGGLAVYPTETVYGLGADATSDEAVSRVFKAKSRSFHKPISVAVNSFEMACNVGEISSKIEGLFSELLPGPLSFIVKARSELSENLSAGTGKISIRVPNNGIALKLISKAGVPITSTSANISGRPSPKNGEEAFAQLQNRVNLILDAGEAKIGKPSTIIDFSERELRIVREGPISISEVRKALEI